MKISSPSFPLLYVENIALNSNHFANYALELTFPLKAAATILRLSRPAA